MSSFAEILDRADRRCVKHYRCRSNAESFTGILKEDDHGRPDLVCKYCISYDTLIEGMEVLRTYSTKSNAAQRCAIPDDLAAALEVLTACVLVLLSSYSIPAVTTSSEGRHVFMLTATALETLSVVFCSKARFQRSS